MAGTIKQGHPKNRVRAANDFVRQPRAKQRHEVIHEHEQMNNGRGCVRRLAETAFGHLAGDVTGENTPHSIVTEPFAGFIADDVFNLWRPAGGGRIWFSGHAFGSPAYGKMGPMSRPERWKGFSSRAGGA